MTDTPGIIPERSRQGDTMSGMGTHSHPNGHRGDDGAAAVATLEPFAISPALQVQRLVPMPQVTQERDDRPGRWQRFRLALRVIFARRAWLAAVPIVLVNAVAFAGQLAFLRGHLPWPLAGQVLVAVTLESVAVYLAWQAHLALAADDSALRLRLAAYGFAGVIGVMNFSHYAAPGWHPTFAAVAFGLMSVSSPWLWSVHSRRVSRDTLKARGLIEPHAVRLGATRWLWHPLRCIRVMSRAAWKGESDPARAIALPAMKVPLVAPVVARDDNSRYDRGDRGDSLPPRRHPPSGTKAVKPPPPAVLEAVQPEPSGRARAAAILKAEPGLKNADIARRAGVDVRTVQRARNKPAGASS